MLFLLVALESAGVPLPGETSVIAAGVLCSSGHLSLPLVITVAASAAVVGDNVGYVLGRTGARRLLAGGRRRAELLRRGEKIFARWGGKAVFAGRWVTGVRVVVAWAAGAARYPWPRFLVWNALGGIAWASSITAADYFLGEAVEKDVRLAGLAALALAALGVLGLVVRRRAGRREAGNAT